MIACYLFSSFLQKGSIFVSLQVVVVVAAFMCENYNFFCRFISSLSLSFSGDLKKISLSAFAFIYDNNMNCPTSTDELSFKNVERDMLQRNIINKHLWWRRWRRCDEIGGREKKESWKWSKKRSHWGHFDNHVTMDSNFMKLPFLKALKKSLLTPLDMTCMSSVRECAN